MPKPRRRRVDASGLFVVRSAWVGVRHGRVLPGGVDNPRRSVSSL